MLVNRLKIKKGFGMLQNILKTMVYIYLTLSNLVDLIRIFFKQCNWPTLFILMAKRAKLNG
jgi:hypothetical protein